MKTIEINGNQQEVPTDVESVQQLLAHLALDHRILVVEHNHTVLEKGQYDQPIRNRDQIEIIHFVGGG